MPSPGRSSQPGLPRSSSSSSPVFGRTPNAGPESSGVVLIDVGTAQMTKEDQKPATEKWRRFMAAVSGTCVMGVTVSNCCCWRLFISHDIETARQSVLQMNRKTHPEKTVSNTTTLIDTHIEPFKRKLCRYFRHSLRSFSRGVRFRRGRKFVVLVVGGRAAS